MTVPEGAADLNDICVSHKKKQPRFVTDKQFPLLCAMRQQRRQRRSWLKTEKQDSRDHGKTFKPNLSIWLADLLKILEAFCPVSGCWGMWLIGKIVWPSRNSGRFLSVDVKKKGHFVKVAELCLASCRFVSLFHSVSSFSLILPESYQFPQPMTRDQQTSLSFKSDHFKSTQVWSQANIAIILDFGSGLTQGENSILLHLLISSHGSRCRKTGGHCTFKIFLVGRTASTRLIMTLFLPW